MTFNAFVGAHMGNPGELKLGIDIPPVPPTLPDGFTLPTEVVDVGVALRVSL
jgi:hypothetical protein